MKINEILDQKYPWRWVEQTKTHWQAFFKSKDNSIFEVFFTNTDPSKPVWYMSFDRNKSPIRSGTGDQFKVFATVGDILKSFILEKNSNKHDGNPVKIIVFFSLKEDLYPDDDKNDKDGLDSRSKLYIRFLDKISKEMGFKTYYDDSNKEEVSFYIEIPDNKIPHNMSKANEQHVLKNSTHLDEVLKKVNGRWALVSKTNPNKVLQYYRGPKSKKPSKEWVSKVERRVHSFENARFENKKITNESFDVHSFANELEQKYGLKDLWISDHRSRNAIELSSIIVPKEKHGQGIGSKVMEEIIKFADDHGLIIVLDPAIIDKSHGTTSQSRLRKFYKRFGFIENKGRNKNYEFRHLMIRYPKKKVSEKDALSSIHGKQKFIKPHPDETLGIKRKDMPQIHKKHYNELLRYLEKNGITTKKEILDPAILKATQKEFSDNGIEKMIKNNDPNKGTTREKPLIVSSDNYVIDGHHRWLAALNLGEKIPVLKFNAPVRKLLDLVKNFKYTTYKDMHERAKIKPR